MPLDVVGAGFSRTGTSTLKRVLEELGFGLCYHATEVDRNPGHELLWQRHVNGEPIDWDSLFQDYRATVDWPAFRFYRELAEACPDAKVVLSVRDVGAWYASFKETVYRFLRSGIDSENESVRRWSRFRYDHLIKGMFADRFLDENHARRVYEEHNEGVVRDIDASRLLVYDVAEGWEPLCDFLGVAVPEKPYPHANDRESAMRAIFDPAARALNS